MQWFYETVVLLHELLAVNGSLYVHLDWHVAHYVKCLIDEVFGRENFRNEIIWRRTTARSGSEGFNHIHDAIFFMSKSADFTWNVQYLPYSEEYLKQMFRSKDTSGKNYRESPLTAPGLRNGWSGKSWRGVDPSKIGVGRHWALPGFIKDELSEKAKQNTLIALDELEKMGRIVWAKEGKGRPNLKQYTDDLPGVELQSIWTEFVALSGSSTESTDYPTQKPEALLERIIRSSSNENDLILDCFIGSGTTAAVAERLNRRWIACDLGRFAIHTTRKRLLGIDGVRPFIVQNLGKYERQLWQTGQFAKEGPETPQQADARQRAYVAFILELYGAKPVNGRTWLHGVKGGRMVHVGGVEAPVSVGDVQQIAVEFKKAMGTGKDAPTVNGVDVLGWDFAFELNEVAKQQAIDANILMNFKRIPRDVMDKRAVEQGEIKFFELAALSVGVKTGRAGSVSDRRITLTLSDFVIPPDDVPEDVRQAVKHWSQWIDYWAVDLDNKSDTFHNQWQAFRTRKDTKLQLEMTHEYAEPGEYRVVVKVIDILGNDTTKTVKVKVK